MGALENLIYGVKDIFAEAGAVLRPRRSRVWFRNGLTVTDDPTNNRQIIDAAGGAGLTPGGAGGDLQVNDGAGALAGLSPGADGDVPIAAGGAWTSAPLTKAAGATGDIAGTTFDPANLHVLAAGETVAHSAATVGNTDKLKAAPVDSDTCRVLNASGGAITVDGNGHNVYLAGATDTLVDGETATYRYVTSLTVWMRLA